MLSQEIRPGSPISGPEALLRNIGYSKNPLAALISAITGGSEGVVSLTPPPSLPALRAHPGPATPTYF